MSAEVTLLLELGDRPVAQHLLTRGGVIRCHDTLPLSSSRSPAWLTRAGARWPRHAGLRSRAELRGQDGRCTAGQMPAAMVFRGGVIGALRETGRPRAGRTSA